MRSRALMLSEPQVAVLAKVLRGQVLTPEEQRLKKTIRFRVEEMIGGIAEEQATR